MIDLHVHSTFSDGSFIPEDLIHRAVEEGLYAMALTDHDTVGGIPRFLAAAEGKPVVPVPGVEISADFSPGTMHMLGYFFDPKNETLNSRLQWLREGRDARNQEILHKLIRLGLHISWAEVKKYAEEDVVGRPHFAQALLARGYVANKDEAFERYLGKGKPAYAERRRLTMKDSIDLISGAGGVAVLAHPFTLKLPSKQLKDLVRELRDFGLAGIEVYYSEHTTSMQREYLKLAKEFGLVATGGSDFHGALTPDIALGRGFGSLKIADDIVAQLLDRRKT